MPPATDRSPERRDAGAFAFFFYGTLCDSDVRAAVFGRSVDVTPASLRDHEAVPAERGRFPILLFLRGRAAAGALCDGVTVAEAARLGFYEHEGRDYAARRLAVEAGSDSPRPAWVFLPTAALKRGPGRWDLAEWQRFAKREFLARAERRMRALEARELQPWIELWRGRAAQ